MSDITMSILRSEDAEQYVNLRLEALRENPEAFLSTYEETVSDQNLLETWRNRLTPSENGFTMGAFRADSLVSVATLIRENRLKIKHKANLVGVYTTPAQRGKGVAKEIVAKMLEKAKEMEGLEQINLTVASQNTAAFNLYLSLGFEKFGTEKNALKYNTAYWDEDYMALKLNLEDPS